MKKKTLIFTFFYIHVASTNIILYTKKKYNYLTPLIPIGIGR